LNRHTRVKTKPLILLERERVPGSTRTKYEDFFHRLGEQLRVKNIKPCNVVNVDEHGMQETETTASTVIGDSLTDHSVVTGPDNTTWVSIIEAVTAEGRRLTPVIIFTGASLQGQWFPPFLSEQEDLRDWKYDHSLTGWSNAEIFLKWLKEVYLPQTKPANETEWRLLVLNEHSSHESTEFMYLCQQHQVQLLYLPPHSSHKSQPLDRNVFSPLKTYFRQATKPLAHCRSSAPANKQRFLLCYREASRRACTIANIRSGFKRTGIWPYKPSAILDDPEALVGDGAPPRARPPTSSVNTIATPPLFATPKRSQDVRQVLDTLEDHLSPQNRSVRALFRKAEKALGAGAAERAILIAENNRLKEDQRATRPYTRRKVREPPNDRFARIEDIVTAEEASRKVSKRRRVAGKPAEEPVAEEVQEMITVNMSNIRRLLDMSHGRCPRCPTDEKGNFVCPDSSQTTRL